MDRKELEYVIKEVESDIARYEREKKGFLKKKEEEEARYKNPDDADTSREDRAIGGLSEKQRWSRQELYFLSLLSNVLDHYSLVDQARPYRHELVELGRKIEQEDFELMDDSINDYCRENMENFRAEGPNVGMMLGVGALLGSVVLALIWKSKQ